jgi:pilus assembly protein CpaC
MTRSKSFRTALAALIAMSGVLTPAPLRAADPSYPVTVTAAEVGVLGDGATKFVPIGVGKTVVVDLPRDAKDVLVADPKIANAVVRTSRRAYLIGVAVGQTNVFFFDASGAQIIGFDIAVTRDLNGIRAAIKRMFPESDIKVEGIGDGIVLSGSAANQMEAQQAYDLAARLAGDANKAVNNISVRGRDQVMLKVTVAEVQRDVIKQLGINLSGSFGVGTSVVNFNTDNPFTASGQALSNSAVTPSFGTRSGIGTVADPLGLKSNLAANVRAMERAGVMRTLAEPNLTAISGESANFLAGGEFPVPAGRTCDQTGFCTDAIVWKKFGVGLTFTPIVLSEGRISLKVGTEVSELSSENSVQLSGLSIPSLRVRRADTTVEIPSGGSLAMAGMIQEQTKQQINGMPGVMNVPILGALFKSRDYINRQTELVVLVTPYVVRAVAPKNMARPDDGYADASDASGTLLGRFNKLYGVPGKSYPKHHQTYRGNYGFILD